MIPAKRSLVRAFVRCRCAWWERPSGPICPLAVGVVSESMLRCVLFCLLAVFAHAQVFEGKTLVKASLLADTKAIVPGKPFEVGILLEMDPNWHTYWE